MENGIIIISNNNNTKRGYGASLPIRLEDKSRKKCFHQSLSGGSNEEPGNFTHIIMLPRTVLYLPFRLIIKNLEDHAVDADTCIHR